MHAMHFDAVLTNTANKPKTLLPIDNRASTKEAAVSALRTSNLKPKGVNSSTDAYRLNNPAWVYFHAQRFFMLSNITGKEADLSGSFAQNDYETSVTPPNKAKNPK